MMNSKPSCVLFGSELSDANPSSRDFSEVREVSRKYDIVIGIEIHCQLATESKLFSVSANAFGSVPNSNIDPTCLGLPGALPVLNEACVDLAIRMGIATDCTVEPVSVFERKNYFYPDLPKGYQITQLDMPVCSNGTVELTSGKKVRIDRIQLEEDAGKNIHQEGSSLLDFNRSGVGLIEIVSAPDLSSPEEASEYVKRIHAYAVNLGVSDGDMERGNFRADANVSLKPKGQTTLGQRTEIKNLNSFKFLEKAIAFEIERQCEVLESGGFVAMETRGYNSTQNETFSQRSKESAHDYRYFPEPDLPPLFVSKERIARVKASMPELPEAKAKRLATTFGVTESDARLLATNKVICEYFETLMKALDGKVEAKSVCHYTLTEITRVIRNLAENSASTTEELVEVPVPIAHSLEIILLLNAGTLNIRMVREILDESLLTGQTPKSIVDSKGLMQVSDDGPLLAIINKVLSENEAQLNSYLNGKDKLFGFFVGQCMKSGDGKLNPARLNDLLKESLESKRTQNET